MSNKHVFVSGATGFQGRPTAQLLNDKGYTVTTLQNSSSDSISADAFVEVLEGGFENLASIQKALKGKTRAVFTLPLIFNKELALTMTKNFIQAATLEGIEHIVFNTSFDLPKEEVGFLAIDIKVAMKQLFDTSELKVTTISPDIYLDNLTAPWSIPLIIEQGILPYPVKNGKKVPWISHSDLARFTVGALEHPESIGETLPIGGTLLTGEEIAESIAQEIGKTVHFISLTPDEFEKNLVSNFGPVMAQEISNLYRFLDSNLERITSKDFVSVQDRLNVYPQSISEWLKTVQWS